MGAAASDLDAEIIAQELRARGVKGNLARQASQNYQDGRELDDEKILRDNMIALIKQYDAESRDEQLALDLDGLSEKERKKPSVERKHRKLLKRRPGTDDLVQIASDMKEAKSETMALFYSAYPPLHAIDRSVDTQLCQDALERLGFQPRQAKRIVHFTVNVRQGGADDEPMSPLSPGMASTGTFTEGSEESYESGGDEPISP
mmetsp:Transcript_27913/g.62292  ORF Transcript_27913/g.62292 Transcript_27913/m.62292 type:complete len:203 (+) Transcript_27913:57-665(+)